MAVTLALLALAGLSVGRLKAILLRRRAVAMTVALMPRTALLGAAAGPPDFDELGFGRRDRRRLRSCSFRGGSFRRLGLACGRGFRGRLRSRICHGFDLSGLGESFCHDGFGFGRWFRRRFDNGWRLLAADERWRVRRERR